MKRNNNFLILYICFFCNVLVVDVSNELLSEYEKPNCEANKTYTAENITCKCTEKGEWPDDECYFHFEKLNSYNQTCEPEKFVFIDCNVCRCGNDSKIDQAQCTQHKCNGTNATKVSRRSSTIDSTCKPKTWYSFAPCRICYCVNKHRLMCNNEYKSSKIHLQNYELNECGGLLQDMNDLMSGKNALRQENSENMDKHKKEIVETSSDESDGNTLEIDKEVDGKYNRLKDDGQKSSKEMKYGVNKTTKPTKIKTKKSELRKGTKDETLKDDSEIESDSSSTDESNVLGNLLDLVLRKSLVSLGLGNKCKPGSTTRIECNNCFCLANGKLLCTKNKCK